MPPNPTPLPKGVEPSAAYQPGEAVFITAGSQYQRAVYAEPSDLEGWHYVTQGPDSDPIHAWAGDIHRTRLDALRKIQSWLEGTLSRVQADIASEAAKRHE